MPGKAVKRARGCSDVPACSLAWDSSSNYKNLELTYPNIFQNPAQRAVSCRIQEKKKNQASGTAPIYWTVCMSVLEWGRAE